MKGHSMLIYTVQPGDDIDSIARVYQIPVSTIIYNNQLIYPYQLAVGQALLLSYEGEADRYVISTNGYAYPFINQIVLRQVLPYMTSLSVFSYGFTPDGSLIPPALDDSPLIQLALSYNASPILTLTPIDANGRFNNNLISSLIHNPAGIEQLIDEIKSQIINRGFQGVDIDFEYILAEDREAFADFVYEVRTAVNTLGYPVSVALAPKTSDDQPGLLYEGKDYALLGAAANSVLLMTYEWGYTYER